MRDADNLRQVVVVHRLGLDEVEGPRGNGVPALALLLPGDALRELIGVVSLEVGVGGLGVLELR